MSVSASAQTKYLLSTVTASPSDKGLPSCVISTINADRDKDHVIPEGMDATAFMRAPVLMWSHGGSDRYAALPIGTVTSLNVTPGQGITAEWRWLENDPMANRVRNAWDQGIVRGTSIGFRPTKMEPNAEGGVDHLAWELLELSVCPIPANPEAVRTLKALGLMDVQKIVPVTDQAEPVRWNVALSKSFDVASQEFPPQSQEQALAAKYCECQVKALQHTEERVTSTRMGAFLSALDEFLADGAVAVDDVRNLDYRGAEAPPKFEDIQLNSKRTQNFLIDGMRFLTWNQARMTLRVEPRWFGLAVTTYIDRAQKNAGAELIGRVKARARELNFLKGEAFALSGEFLPRGDESLSDLFLDGKNAASVKRLLTLVNEKGAQLENRGALLVGPPGTGKTLSGRILMNHAKATFVWVSARDFAYSGGFRGLADAFEIAKDCVPTVLFIEDVDNWIDGHTVDLLKTEMDGIARSSGVLTVLTTNFPELLPKALIDRPGRFHDVLRFDLPDEAARTAMLARWMPGLDANDTARAVKATAGYSGAHVRELVRFASIIAEQDRLTATAALTVALAKLQEQRDLITSVQTKGARYRAQDFVATKAFDAVQKRGRVLSAVNESRLRAAMDALANAGTVLTEVLAQLMPMPEPDDMDEDEHPKPMPMMALDDVATYSLHLAENEDDAPVLRLFLAEDEAGLVTLVDDAGREPTFAIDPAVMRSVIAEAVRDQLHASLVAPIGESIQRALDAARGRVQ